MSTCTKSAYISIVPLDVVSSKTLLPLPETCVSQVAAIRSMYKSKGLYFKDSDTLKYLAFSDVVGNKRHPPCLPSDANKEQFKLG